ncbi:penicillin-binding protein 2 [candidate division KSB1 bacterium]|nr:penicillin-binding protein 2 [candidate division KSB1 bacterium]NIR72157.1 penicillin-binding protein 2 [candidate division KSB1 bacterium]NIS26622.1 penicillin-binding protein 2 [candidate division KSB1 bacterium]NIT73390.1 penicillin-binding protein 2 [candidate division KSB1 bacterium]NIU27238.1 penicillin-binding protein 2 [candidate division KSB1 bacterium]
MNERLSNIKLFYRILTISIFVILAIRFAQLQLFNWDQYFRESEKNRIREVILESPRGMVYDRNGEILIDNRPAYSVSVVPYEFLQADSSVTLLSSILDQSPNAIKSKINKEASRFRPVKIKRQISFATLSHIEEFRLDLPGVFYSIESKRFYPAGIRAPHLFGYLGEIDSKELKYRKDSGYRMGDLIGKKGLELQYEKYLRGEPGVKYVEVDALGREIRVLEELSTESPTPGENLYLTLDANLQRHLEGAMDGKRGAAVVLDPRNGEILAMVSKPDYDPKTFSKPITTKLWKKLVNNEGKPLYNRACQSVYPPGSTFKLVLAAAGVETGLINPQEKILCRGAYRLGRRLFRCWKEGGHGDVNLTEAIEQSCNVYFFTRSLEVGLENWCEFAKLFRFGKLTGLDLPNESTGTVPDSHYLDRKFGKKGWTRGLILNLSVGQGDLLATPLQMAYLAMILGNEGLGFRPHLLKKHVDPTTGVEVVQEVKSRRVQGISSKTFRLVKLGMYMVVNGQRGTGRAAWIPKVKVCGKTGTAQNPHGEDHAWFIGFAPQENPEIAFCIMVENAGSGGAIAAPIARGMLSKYFDKRQKFALK